jgi:hypothetical protein
MMMMMCAVRVPLQYSSNEIHYQSIGGCALSNVTA